MKSLRYCLLSIGFSLTISVFASCVGIEPADEALEQKVKDARLQPYERKLLLNKTFTLHDAFRRDYLDVRCKLEGLGTLIDNNDVFTVSSLQGYKFIIFFTTTTTSNTILNYMTLTDKPNALPVIHSITMSDGGEVQGFYLLPAGVTGQPGELQFIVAVSGDYPDSTCFHADCFYAETKGPRGPRLVRMASYNTAPNGCLNVTR